MAATRALRSTLGYGAAKLASSDRLMGAIYDLTNETNFSGLSEHEEMLSDRIRVDAYHEGIRRTVKKGDVVLDLGTGSGLLAFMASRAGAAKVYAVEHSDFIEVAREIAAHNDITNIEFVQANSREFTPPEPVDVVLHEQMGDELFNENMLENVIDLRNRVLGPEGRILPAHFKLFIEPVTFNDSMRVRRFWNTELPDGLNLSALEQSVTAARFDTGRTEQLWVRPGSVASTVGMPAPILEFDLHTLQSVDVLPLDHVISREADADVIVDGFCVWFEAAFDDHYGLSTSPLSPVTSWGNRMFRFDEEIAAGESLRYHVNLGQLIEPSTWTVERL
jgi:protein arginine N-methyltransferase 1